MYMCFSYQYVRCHRTTKVLFLFNFSKRWRDKEFSINAPPLERSMYFSKKFFLFSSNLRARREEGNLSAGLIELVARLGGKYLHLSKWHT
jgi:hypothetical protein